MERLFTLSTCIIVYNEERNIERCLNSLQWVDEIVVVDSCSTDRTVEICRKFTDKIFSRPFSNYSDQKNFALSQATGEWVLSLDADEEVTQALTEEMKALLQLQPKFDGYRICRTSHIFGRKFRFSGTQDDKPVRLFRKRCGEFVQPVHEYVLLRGAAGELKGGIIHRTYINIADYLSRLNRYTTMEAEFLAAKRSRVSVIDWLFRPQAVFIKLYIFQQGFRDGLEGFLFCFLSGCYTLIKYIKCMEIMAKRGGNRNAH